MAEDSGAFVRKTGAILRERRFPWPTLKCLLRGLARDPVLALKLIARMRFEDKFLLRFDLQIHGKDLLEDFYAESAKLGLRPFLLWGTLLGCVREGRLLAHDYDLDTGVLPGDYAKKDALIAAMLARGYLLRKDEPMQFSFERPDRLLHLDVDLVYPLNGWTICSNFEEDGEVSVNALPEAAFRELAPAVFLGIPVWLPGRAEAVLESCYGEWRTPVEEHDYRSGPQNRVLDPEFLRAVRAAAAKTGGA